MSAVAFYSTLPDWLAMRSTRTGGGGTGGVSTPGWRRKELPLLGKGADGGSGGGADRPGSNAGGAGGGGEATGAGAVEGTKTAGGGAAYITGVGGQQRGQGGRKTRCRNRRTGPTGWQGS